MTAYLDTLEAAIKREGMSEPAKELLLYARKLEELREQDTQQIRLVADYFRERGKQDYEAETVRICGLCGHHMTIETCGSASADGYYLCHADDHSCYHRWTVYKERPTSPQES